MLPAATFAEGDGTLVSFEGRAQRFFQVFVPAEEIPESWRVLDRLAVASGRAPELRWPGFADVCGDVAASAPLLAPVAELVPEAPIPGFRLPRQPHRYSGRTAMNADRSVHEPQPPEDPDSPLAYSMEGLPAELDPALASHYRAPGWNSVSGLNKLQTEVGGPLRGGDPGRRLLEPSSDGDGTSYLGTLDLAEPIPEGALLVLPQPEVFGGEELSSGAPAVATRSGAARLQLSDADSEGLGLAEGDELTLVVDGTEVRLPVSRRGDLPAGIALVPTGRPDVPFLSLPAHGVPKR